MCLHCWLCNTQTSSFRWLACPASGSTWLRLYSGLRWRKHVSLKRKHVLRHQESKILGRAANSAEVVLLSNSPIHFNTSSTSTEDKAHLGFLLQQFSYLLLLLLDISQPFFVNALCPISAQYWVWHVQDCRDLGRFNHHSAPWYIHIFPVLDWDPKQWLIVLAHHPSIHHALHHKLTSINAIYAFAWPKNWPYRRALKGSKRRIAFSRVNLRVYHQENGQSEQVRGQCHTPRTLETWRRVGQSVCPKLGRGSHRQTDMQRFPHRLSTQMRNSSEYALDRWSR